MPSTSGPTAIGFRVVGFRMCIIRTISESSKPFILPLLLIACVAII
jgi:hypothetical protein